MNANIISQIDMRNCGWALTGFYLLLGFFTPLGFSGGIGAVGLIGYSLLMVMVALVHLAGKGGRGAVSIPSLVLLVLLAIAFCISCIASPYGHATGLRIVLFLLDAVILVGILKVQDCAFQGKWFYVISTVCLAVTFVIYVVNPTFFMDFGGAHRTIDALAPLLWGAADQNRTALFVFAYFSFSVKQRKKLGIAISLIYPFLYFGRQYLIMVTVVLVFLFLAQRLHKPDLMAALFRARNIFVYFLASVLAVSLFSLFWVNVVMVGGVGEYKSGWNDSSNAMRMSSVQYISSEIVKSPSYIIYGLDSDMFDVLGISDDTRRGQTYYVNDKYRLVQPHQEVLNTLLKEGLLITLGTYGLVSYLLSLVVKDRYSRATVLAYLLGSLTLHEMLIAQSLLLLLLVLCAKSELGETDEGRIVEKVSQSVSGARSLVAK